MVLPNSKVTMTASGRKCAAFDIFGIVDRHIIDVNAPSSRLSSLCEWWEDDNSMVKVNIYRGFKKKNCTHTCVHRVAKPEDQNWLPPILSVCILKGRTNRPRSNLREKYWCCFSYLCLVERPKVPINFIQM